MANYDLNKLAHYFGVTLPDTDTSIHCNTESQNIAELTIDSRLVHVNDLFIALNGHSYDGRNFIPQALKAGAIAILAETDLKSENKTLTYHLIKDKKIVQINIYQLADKISAFAADFYHNPSEKMQVIGVTGTNGKTTITQLIAQWIQLIGKKSAVLGTLGNGLYGQLQPSNNTTPSSVDVQCYLAKFLAEKVDVVAMEVSSHGLILDRVKDVHFSASLLTNLSRDHLDFHHTMDNYKKAKWSLFSPHNSERAVKSSGHRIINFDDDVGLSWIRQLDDVIIVSANINALEQVKAFGKTYIAVSSIRYHDQGASISFESSFGCGNLESHLFGGFNVSNLLLAFAALLSLGYAFYDLVNCVANLSPIDGRMEVFTAEHKPTVIVDYAHTPDALDKALDAAKMHCEGKLWVIFGCGGDRDRGKRPLMAQVAQSHTQHIIITNDNPRTENQDFIIQDIVAGLENSEAVKIIKDRHEAIQWAIDHSKPNDFILVAGKGHEDYQIIDNVKHHYSDRETVSRLLGITL